MLNIFVLFVTFICTQSLAKKTHSETYYRQPAMESYAYDALFFITYAQVRIS